MTKMESLPNEILLHIFSYLSWFDMLISFWSLSIRFDSLVCSILSMNDNRLNSGLLFTRGLSYNKYSTILFPLISNSSFLSSSIRRIHLDGTNSSAYDLCYELLFNDQNILRFPNLKSLILTRCGSIKSIFQGLPYLIEHQLDELTLTFDDQLFSQVSYIKTQSPMMSDIDKQFDMIEQIGCQLFSVKCNLKSLQLDLRHSLSHGTTYRCRASNYFPSSNSIQYEHRSSCLTLRRLHIQLIQAHCIENLIERLPNLEEMSIECLSSLEFNALRELNLQTLRESKENWFNKMPKLRYFCLKTFLLKDLEFVHLKWLLNNLNYIEKLQVHLKGSGLIDSPDQNTLWKSFIDANFIREYCLPDTTPNLIDFNFYICSECQLSPDDIERITNSFKTHSFFISHRWTNVKCLFDPMMSCQHLFSSFTPALHISPSHNNYSFIFNWSHIDKFFTHAHPSLYLFLEQFNELSSNISCIKLYRRYNNVRRESDLRMSSEILFQFRQFNGIDFRFRNVTKILFGVNFDRRNAGSVKPTDRNPIREKVLAGLISMTVQLKCLVVEQFEWLLHVVQYSSDELRTNALSTVRYAEFCLPYRFIGYKTATRSVGKRFVSFLSTYMPHLQTLCLWRSDDFPWSLARRAYRPGYLYTGASVPWLGSSETSESIAKRVSIFEQDLCQLVEGLKDFTFLNIYGGVSYEKAQAYFLMAQTHFPRAHICVEVTRFRLWL